MTKLEEEMRSVIATRRHHPDIHSDEEIAQVAAEVAKKWITRALVDLQSAYKYNGAYPDSIEKWEGWYFRSLGIDSWPEYTHPDIQADIIKYKEECLQRLKEDIQSSKKRLRKIRKK